MEWYLESAGYDNHPALQRSQIARMTHQQPPFSALAFVSNDEMDHRIVFFQIPKAKNDPDKRRHTGLQHVAFEYATLDDLLGTYVRLKGLGIPLLVAGTEFRSIIGF